MSSESASSEAVSSEPESSPSESLPESSEPASSAPEDPLEQEIDLLCQALSLRYELYILILRSPEDDPNGWAEEYAADLQSVRDALDSLERALSRFPERFFQEKVTVYALLEHLRVRGTFDIYLLDVIMPGQNGIELGLSIREFDQGGRIIYLTASSDFAVDSYRAKASDYLLKPLDKSRLFQSLDNIIKSLELEPHACVMIKTREGLRRLPLHSIVYGELVGRCIQYHLSNGSVITGMSLRG